MAFNLDKFVVLSGQGKRGEAFQTCGYLTQDDKSEVTSAGYFNELRGSLSVNDVISVYNNTDGDRASYTLVVSGIGVTGVVETVEGSSFVTSVNGKTGDVVLTKDDIGLDQVDNTSDADKPISDATQVALDANSALIATNTADIATNAGNIATNTANISTNTSNIATNASNITANANEITDLKSVDNIKLPISDELYYSGVNDASEQYTTTGTTVYSYRDYSYTINSLDNAPYESVSGYSAKDFKAEIKFKLNDNTSAPLIGAASDLGSGNVCLFLTIINGTMYLYMSDDGNTWSIANGLTGTNTYATLTVYNVRLRRDDNNWYVDYSIDNGETWVNDITLNSSSDLYELTLNWNWGAEYVGTDTSMNGKVFLDGTSLFLNGDYRFQPQIGDYIENTLLWKGKARSDDNTTNIVANDFVRSDKILNASNQYLTSGSPVYDYTDYSFDLNGTSQFIYTENDGTTVDYATEFDVRAKFNMDTDSPFIIFGQTSDTIEGVLIYINAGLLTVQLSSNGTSWDIANGTQGTKVYNTGTTYNVRWVKTPTQFLLDYSEDDGQTWINDITINNSSILTSTFRFVLGYDGYGTNSYANGKFFLDGCSMTADGVEFVSPQDPTELVDPNEQFYYFVGLDSSSDVVLERDTNIDGSGLSKIVGAKRRIGDDKDIVFPSDDLRDLVSFVREQNIYRFTLWSGYIATSTTLFLPRKIDEYRDMEIEYLASGDTLRTNFRRFPMARIKDFYLNNAPRVEIRESTASVNHAVDMYLLSRDVRFLGFEQMAVVGVYGII